MRNKLGCIFLFCVMLSCVLWGISYARSSVLRISPIITRIPAGLPYASMIGAPAIPLSNIQQPGGFIDSSQLAQQTHISPAIVDHPHTLMHDNITVDIVKFLANFNGSVQSSAAEIFEDLTFSEKSADASYLENTTFPEKKRPQKINLRSLLIDNNDNPANFDFEIGKMHEKQNNYEAEDDLIHTLYGKNFQKFYNSLSQAEKALLNQNIIKDFNLYTKHRQIASEIAKDYLELEPSIVEDPDIEIPEEFFGEEMSAADLGYSEKRQNATDINDRQKVYNSDSKLPNTLKKEIEKIVALSMIKAADRPAYMLSTNFDSISESETISPISPQNKGGELTVTQLAKNANRISYPIKYDQISHKINEEVQKKQIKDIVKITDDSRPRTFIMPYEQNIDSRLLLKYLNKDDFVVKMASPPERFEFNMTRIRNRKPSERVVVFDFSPRSKDSLQKMELPEEQVKRWQKISHKISKLVDNYKRYGIEKPKSNLNELIEELKKDEGVVVVIYGHSDGENIWLDTEDGVEKLSKKDIKKYFKNSLLPPVVLLNCEGV